MRKDMKKVIVERPRRGGKHDKGSKGRVKDISDLPKKESMKRSYTDRKSLNENLAPLRRFLESKVGQKWDKVFSEICENLTLNTGIEKHVRDHVPDFVFINVQKENNRIFSQYKYGGNITEIQHNDLYVDPDTGILKKYKYGYIPEKRDRQTSTELFLEKLSNKECKVVLEDGYVYKIYFDKVTQTWSNKNKATKKHAKADLTWSTYMDRHQVYLFENVNKEKLINKDDEYWNEYCKLFNAARKEMEVKYNKKQKSDELKVGTEVLFKRGSEKEFKEGVIISKTDVIGQPVSYNVLWNNQNVVLSGYVKNFQIKKKG